jgi:hypothetical protein
MESPKFSVSSDQWKMIGKSILKYTGPLVLVFLVSLKAGTPIKEAIPVLYGAALQLVINFLSKYLSETK